MKRLVGGEYLLDLTPIEIEESENVKTYTNITNKDVIEQLTNLKKYISNPNGIKPVWVKLKNGETDELIVARGEFKVVDTSEFEIVIHLDGYKLLIHIEFTQATLEDDTPIDDWYIAENDAKYLFTTDAQNIGAISELPVFENIVDAEEHERFIEGDITINEISGVTKTYGKWSLSGTHLMIVLALSITNETSIADNTTLCSIDVPQWVKDKIVPIVGGTIVFRDDKAYASDYTNQTLLNRLVKPNERTLQIRNDGAWELTKDRIIRIAYDLLIDVDYE